MWPSGHHEENKILRQQTANRDVLHLPGSILRK